VSLGQGPVKVGAALAGALDLRPDVIDGSHARSNESACPVIPPSGRRKTAR
jgi:hypothetical protein